MKAAAAALVCAGLGLLTADALADLVPVPTVPSVTVPTVPVPVPTVPVPTVPVPTIPLPPPPTTVPKVTTAPSTPSVPATTLPGTGATSPSATLSSTPRQSVPTDSSVLGTTGSGGGSNPSPGSSASGTSSQGSNGPQVKEFQSTRPWISTTGNKNRGSTVLTFVLKRPTRVIFTVEQLAPACQTVGRFSVRGRAGVNRVRFSGRVGREQLDPGTYRITARTVHGRALKRIVIAVVDRAAPTPAELAALRAANVCPRTGGTGTAGSTGASNTGWLSGADDVGSGQPSAGSPATSGSDGALGGILGSATVEKTAKAIRPGLIALLAAAILLLGLASLPRVAFADERINEALARHRAEITAVGAVALVAVVVTFLFG